MSVVLKHFPKIEVLCIDFQVYFLDIYVNVYMSNYVNVWRGTFSTVTFEYLCYR